MTRTPRLRFLLSPLAVLLVASSPYARPQATTLHAALVGKATQDEQDGGGKKAKDKDAKDRDVKDKDAKDNDKAVVPASALTNPVIWQKPENIASRDLYFGQGGEKHQPKPPFTFDHEVMSGTNPKFDVRDADGKKWRVKLGEEPKPEVVASRLLWAVGYFANDDYLLPSVTVANLKLKRGQDHVKNFTVTDARFQRRPGGEEKIGIWQWNNNPFTGKREGNGLRVMMAVINNWDLKDENNAVYTDSKTGQQILLCSDVGAAFGTNGLSFSRSRSKGNLNSFKGSKFITRKTDTEVDFATPAAPNAYLLQTFGFGAISYAERAKLDALGKNIPIADARWIGSLLGQLTHKQLEDAFRAGHFDPAEADVYVTLIENRIAQLKAL